jgi:ubiquinone/menaquinone biosynthesis C-methylase UbiE
MVMKSPAKRVRFPAVGGAGRIPADFLRSSAQRTLESAPVHLDEDAAEYGRMIDRHAWLLNRPFVEMLSSLGLGAGKVLDVGTGPGWIPIQLALRRPKWEVWALDASEDMLELGRRNAVKAGVGERVHFVNGDARSLPFETGEFDLAASHFMLHHMDEPGPVLDEMARVVRGGGRVIVKDLARQPLWKAKLLLAFSKLVLGYSPEQMRMYRESLDSALTLEDVRSLLPRTRLSMASVRGFRGLDFVITA